MEKLNDKVTKLVQNEKVDEAIELISETLTDLGDNIKTNEIIQAYHLFYKCYSIKDLNEAHKSLNTAAKYIAEEGNKKIQYDRDGAIEDFTGAVIRHAFGGDLERAELILKQLNSFPKINNYENYHLAKDIFEALRTKKIDDLFQIKKTYKKFFNNKENNWAIKEIEYHSIPIIEVEVKFPDIILAGAEFRLDLIIKNLSPNIAKKIETKIFPPKNFHILNPNQHIIKVKRLDPGEKYNHYAEFFIDEKEYGQKNIEYDLLTFEDSRGAKYDLVVVPTELKVGSQSGVFAGTITQKAPKLDEGLKILDLSIEDKKSIDKLKKKKMLIDDLVKKNEENLKNKLINNEEYTKLYAQYKEKLEEINNYLKNLGFKEKEGYTEVTCLYDNTKFYVEDGKCPKCTDLYTQFFDEIVSIFYLMIIHSSGICIFNKEFGKNLDPDLTSGLITAVQNFLGELTGENKNKFTEFNQSGFNILTYNGKYSSSAIVTSIRASDRIKERIKKFQELFENNYKNQLAEFTGDLSEFSQSSDILEQFLPLDLLLPHNINYELIQEENISSISQQIIKEVPEINEKKVEKIYLDNLVDIARRRLRRLDYGNLVAAVLELREKGVLSIEKKAIEEVTEKEAVGKVTPHFCIECGAELPPKTEKIQFCINCGAKQAG